VTTRSFPAVGRARRESGVAFSADLLVAVVFGCQHFQRWLDDSSTETQHQVECGLLLNVVVTQSTAIFELLPGEYESLLVGGNAFLVLDLGLYIVDGV